VSKYVVKELVI